MEEHPIPQNVTQFEFKLVGEMTLKQFGYLAAGLALAYVTYMVLSKPLPFLAYPMIVVFAATGAAFAFLPISERPLDHWVKAYLKAIMAPTQMTYQAQDLAIDSPFYEQRLALYLDTVPEPEAMPKPSAKLAAMSQMAPATQQVIPSAPEPQPEPVVTPPSPTPQPESTSPAPQPTPPAPPAVAPIPTPSVAPMTAPVVATPAPQPIQQPVQPAPMPAAQPAPAAPQPQPAQSVIDGMPSDENLSKMVEYAKEAQIVQTEIVEAEKQLEEIKVQAAQPGNNPQEFSNNFRKVMETLAKLNTEAEQISKQMAQVSDSNAPSPSDPRVKVVSAETKPTEKFVTLTTTANIVNGIVTDSQGNYLDGVIIVVHDKDDLPVRALKSNKLGQFLAATPLQNGTYTMTLEKDNLSFDVLQIELDGSVLPPIRIEAKKGA